MCVSDVTYAVEKVGKKRNNNRNARRLNLKKQREADFFAFSCDKADAENYDNCGQKPIKLENEELRQFEHNVAQIKSKAVRNITTAGGRKQGVAPDFEEEYEIKRNNDEWNYQAESVLDKF